MSASRTEYTPLLWVNESTELSAQNLNHLEQGVALNNALAIENALFIDEIYTAFVEQLNVSFDSQTNVFTFSFGSTTGNNPTSRFHKEIHFTLDIQSDEIDYLKYHAMIDGEYYPESHVGKADDLHTERTIEDLDISCPPITYGVAGGEAEISTGVQELTELYGNGVEGVKAAKLISRGKNQFQAFGYNVENTPLNDVIGGEEYKLFGLESGFYVREFLADKTIHPDGMDEELIEDGGTFILKDDTRYLQIFPVDSSEVTNNTKVMFYNTFGESYNEKYEEPHVDEIALPNIVLRSVGDVRDVAFASGGGIRRISEQGEVLVEPVAITEEENPGWNPEIFIDNYGTLLFLDENDEELSVEQPYQIIYKISLTEFVDSAYVKAKGNASDLALESDIKKGKVVAGLADGLTPYSENSGVRGTNAFLFQTSGGDSDIGSIAYLEKLTGNTAKVVQLVKNGNFADGTNNFEATNSSAVITANNNTLTVKPQPDSSAPAAGIIQRNLPLKYKQNYRYLLKAEIKVNSTHNLFFYMTYSVNSDNSSYNRYILQDCQISGTKKIIQMFTIETLPGFQPTDFNIKVYSNLDYNDSFEIKNLQIIDIEDLENTLGGDFSDSEKFNRIFPLEYYEYTEGKFVSSKSSAYKCVGYNAFDGKLKIGYEFDDNGHEELYRDGFITENYIKVVPGATYSFECDVEGGSILGNDFTIVYYDANKNVISVSMTVINNFPFGFWVPSNCHYVKLNAYVGNPDASKIHICVHLTWDESKTGYEPYYENYYLLPNIELRKVGDAYDELKPDGTLIRRVGIVDLGSLNWSHGGNDGDYFYTDDLDGLIKSPTSTKNNPNILFEKEFSPVSNDNFWELIRNYDATILGGTLKLFCFDYQDDVAALKEHLDGIHMLYELAEPVIEQNDTYKFTRVTEINDFGTQEFISSNEIAVPQGNVIFYPSDYKAFIDSLGGRSDVNYDATKIFSKSDYNKIINTYINERVIFATRDVIGFKMKHDSEKNYIPINPITLFYQSYSATRQMARRYVQLCNKQRLNWSQFKGTKKGNQGFETPLYDDDFIEATRSKIIPLRNLIEHYVLLDGGNFALNFDDEYRNFDLLVDENKPQTYNPKENQYEPLKFNSKVLYCYTVSFNDNVYFDDLVTYSITDTEPNRSVNTDIPGAQIFINLHESFHDKFSDKEHIRFAGKATIRFGLSRGDYNAGEHTGHVVALHQTIIQDTYLELQCLYELTQDLTDDPGLITGFKIFLGVTPKQFK